MSSLIPVQKSQIMFWKRCPLRYEDIFLKGVEWEADIAMNLGRDFHGRAKLFFDEVDYEALKKCETAREAYMLFKTQLPENPIMKEWMDNFFWFEAQRWENIQKVLLWKPLARELELHAAKVGFSPMHIDRIDALTSGNLAVIDYKSGKWWNLADLRFELTFYAIGVNATNYFNSLVTWVGCYNPQLDRQFAEEVKTRTITRVMKTVRLFRSARKKGEYPPKPSMLCRYCHRVEQCLDDGIISPELQERFERADEFSAKV